MELGFGTEIYHFDLGYSAILNRLPSKFPPEINDLADNTRQYYKLIFSFNFQA